jgi:hypothetical protein
MGHRCFHTDATVRHALQVLTNPRLAGEMVELNYRLARRHFSYGVLQRRLRTLIAEELGEDYTDDWSTS